MNQSSITVAIPTYNGARHLAAAIRSVRAQVDVPFELIVVDDRSTDESVTIAERELGGRGRVEVNPERLGLAGNWNRCVALSQTPWVAVFHQDDLMRAGHLRSHVETFEQRSDLGMICGAADVIDDAGASVPASVVSRTNSERTGSLDAVRGISTRKNSRSLIVTGCWAWMSCRVAISCPFQTRSQSPQSSRSA